jgi:hypothetical protein
MNRNIYFHPIKIKVTDPDWKPGDPIPEDNSNNGE